jgi:dihydroflavonol-4-reductase
LENEQSIIDACEGCQYLIHVASPINIKDKEEDLIGPAVFGTTAILKACSIHNVKRFIFTSALLTSVNWENPQDTPHT